MLYIKSLEELRQLRKSAKRDVDHEPVAVRRQLSRLVEIRDELMKECARLGAKAKAMGSRLSANDNKVRYAKSVYKRRRKIESEIAEMLQLYEHISLRQIREEAESIVVKRPMFGYLKPGKSVSITLTGAAYEVRRLRS